MKVGILSKKQKIYSFVCIFLAGDKSEERTTNLLPDRIRIKGLRLFLYKIISSLRYKEGYRLVKKYNTHHFK